MTKKSYAAKFKMTLLEKLIVLVVVGIILAIAGANYLAYKEKYVWKRGGGGARIELRQETKDTVINEEGDRK